MIIRKRRYARKLIFDARKLILDIICEQQDWKTTVRTT